MLKSGRLPVQYLVLLASALFAACHHALFQSPEVLEPGEHAVGVGGAGAVVSAPEVRPHELDLFYRIGMDGNTDLGGRLLYSFNTTVDDRRALTFLVDGKHCVRTGPLRIAGDLGLSWTPAAWWAIGIHPTVMFGTERLYAGARMSIYKSGSWYGWHEGLPSFTVGAKLGKRFYVMPEVTFGWVPWYSRGRYVLSGDPELVLGLAFQYQFGHLAYFDEGPGVPGLHP
ncbi:MAG: hypothetical protein JSU73_08945 [candidate division WOR-3 bacterium]|nr:MAG: hypothetical protein JSU73_08945 [candidate division WOR-3 bacterium]